MLVKFSLDPLIFQYQHFTDLVHRNFLRQWVDLKLALMVDLRTSQGLVLDKAVDTIDDQNLRSQWQTRIVQVREMGLRWMCPMADPETATDLIEFSTDIISKIANLIDVFITTPENKNNLARQSDSNVNGRTILNFPRGRSVEIISLAEFNLLERLTDIQAIRSGGLIPSGSRLNEVWEERFKDFLDCSQRVHIVDRYCLQNESAHPEATFKSGLQNFIRRVSATASRSSLKRKKTLDIYAQPYPESGEIRQESIQQQSASRVRNSLRRVNHPFEKVNLHLIAHPNWSHNFRGRFIRFDKLVVISSDHGIDLFNAPGTNLDNHSTRNAEVLGTFTDIERFRNIENRLAINSEIIQIHP